MSKNSEGEITAAVAAYVLAMSTADEEKLRDAFHPSAAVSGMYQGSVEWLSVDAYVREVVGAGLPPNTNPSWKVISFDVTGDAASAKVEDEFGTMLFTNYLSLLRIDGKWKIVSKLYPLHL